jgi:VanZ family protein
VAAIQYGSVTPVVPVPVVPIPHLDKLLHAGAYGLLTLLLARALRGSSRARSGELALAACLWATAYGGVEELLQRSVPGRSCDFFDVLANAVGATLAALVWHRVATWAARRRNHTDVTMEENHE